MENQLKINKFTLLFLIVLLAVTTSCRPAATAPDISGDMGQDSDGQAASPPTDLSRYYEDRPPAATLVIGDLKQQAGVGTSTWIVEKQGNEETIVHGDSFGLVTPSQPLVVASPFTATLLLPIPTAPTVLWYALAPASETAQPDSGSQEFINWHTAMKPENYLALDEKPEISLTLEPGRYLLEVYVEWADLGSVDYGFFLEVQGLHDAQIYTDPEGQFRLEVPAGWLASQEEGLFMGPDGILRTGFLPQMAFMDSVTRVCERLANMPTPQGPAFQVTLHPLASADACLLTPYPEMGIDQVRLVVENPAGDPEQRYFYLEADAGHIEQIAASLELLNPPGEREAFPYPSGPMRPDDEAFWEETYHLDDVAVDETPIVEASIDSPTRIEFMERIPPEVLEKRAGLRSGTLDSRLARTNDLLEPFGTALKASTGSEVPLFELIRGDESLLEDISMFWPASVSASGSDFALVVEIWNGGYRLVRKESLQKGIFEDWDMGASQFIPPVFYGEVLLSVSWDGQRSQVLLQLEGPQLYAFSAAYLVAPPVKGLWSWEDRWLLEVDGFLTQDGENLNERLGYEEIFGWQVLHDKPFYYFRKGPRVGISYDGQVLPLYYDDIPHYRCCEPAAFNNAGNDDMVWFYGLREGIWYYVEIE
jgi:hypothetical protein